MRASWGDSYGGGGGSQIAMPSLTPVVKQLMIANVAIWLGLYLIDVLFSTGLWPAVNRGLGLTPLLWKDWFPLVPLWQPLTYGFLHGGNITHILFNMLGLYFFGTMLEEIVGSRRFLVLYLGAIVFAGLMVLVFGLLSASAGITIGASGGVLAVVVATAVLRPQTRVIFLVFPMTLKVMAMIFVGLDVFTALESLRGASTSVSWMAHLAGAAFGFVMARKGLIWRDPVEGLEGWREEREEERRERDEERLDRLLEKINREGIHSLSPREKAFLKRASKRR